MKIYTKTGDKGQTSLLSGERVSKHHNRIEAYGTVDELNSFTGLLKSEIDNSGLVDILTIIQNKLYNLGSVLAVEGKISFQILEIKTEDVEFLEKEIDMMNDNLPALKSFILPGGSKIVSLTHVCRTICRRAERMVIKIDDNNKNEIIIQYLNRLSDYFFVLSRKLTKDTDTKENTWTK